MISPNTRPVSLRELLFPIRCLHCGRRGLALGLCPACIRGLRRAPDDLDPPHGLQSVRAAWVYDAGGPARALIHALKFGSAPFLGRPVGVFAAGRLNARLCWDAVIPVPLHRLRRLERGYNQAEQLACGVAEALGLPVWDDAVVRIAGGPPQVGRSRDERIVAMRGAFRVRLPGRVAGRRLLIVDDVITTGATLSAVACTLSAAGAHPIDAFVAAASLSVDAR